MHVWAGRDLNREISVNYRLGMDEGTQMMFVAGPVGVEPI